MTSTALVAALRQRKVSFLLTALTCLVVIVAVTLLLPRQYDATATLFVGERQDAAEALAFDTNIGEQLARTYTTLAAQPSVADVVRGKLAGRPSRESLLNQMTFAPVERTQLLQITARSPSPERARDVANLYAETFVARATGSFERGGVPTLVTVAEPAVAPTLAASPNVPLFIGLGVVLALALGAGAALLRDRLDDRLRIEPGDFEVLGLPVLGRIPEFRSGEAPSRIVADAFRMLRTNIDFAAFAAPRVLAVTSSSPLEGKSTMAAQIAIAAAQAGERVVVVEADLRRPGLCETALGRDLQPALRGVTDYVTGGEPLEAIVSEHPAHPGLAVVWPGALPPNPSRLLASDRFGQLLVGLREHFDRVVVDTSPLSIGPDASIVLTLADATLLVIDGRRTSRIQALAGLAQLDTSRARALGVVVNRADTPQSDAYGYYAAQDEPSLYGEREDELLPAARAKPRR